MGVSLFFALVLSAVDPSWAAQHVTLLVAFGWVQQAALVLGAALVAAGQVVVRLAPPPLPKRDARSDSATDWFS